MARHWIVGLGNIGAEYRDTPHNLGFEVVDELARRSGIGLRVREAQALTGRGEWLGRALGLAQPQTYMNLSGVAVRMLLEKYGGEPADVLVVLDDLDLPLGTLRLRARGSAGTHNGMRSVVEQVGSECARLRLGIAPAHAMRDAAGYVLSPWGRAQRQAAQEMVQAAADGIELLLREGMAAAMTRINARSPAGDEAGEATEGR